ncbi:M-phase inducer phosphatase, partial [Pseudoloma neurophilia]
KDKVQPGEERVIQNENIENDSKKLKKSHFLDTGCHWTIQRGRNVLTTHKNRIETMKRSFSLPSYNYLNHENLNCENFWQSIDNGVRFSLPIRRISDSDGLPRIYSQDLAQKILENNSNIRIIDCRFSYEYQGGHVQNSINIETTNLLLQKLDLLSSKILVFYCEFSSKRAPRLAKYLRNYDRSKNEYPKLDYPEIYVMEGGYKKFYSEYGHLCVPQAYVPMD